jgi:hypothetical protein
VSRLTTRQEPPAAVACSTIAPLTGGPGASSSRVSLWSTNRSNSISSDETAVAVRGRQHTQLPLLEAHLVVAVEHGYSALRAYFGCGCR